MRSYRHDRGRRYAKRTEPREAERTVAGST
jgi:hypothetical protein